MKEILFNNCLAKTHAIEINQNKSIRPCCMFKEPGVEFKNSIQETQTLFKNYTDEQLINGCKVCHQQEKNNITSRRKFFVEHLINAKNSFFYDIQMSNLCNLACTMCSPRQSSRLVPTSKWLRENGMPGYDKPNLVPAKAAIWDNNMIEQLLIDINYRSKNSRVVVSIKGGEPTIQPEVLTFLNSLENKHNISLRIVTNLQVFPEIFENQIDKFYHIDLGVSIEGVGETYEYSRTHGSWTTFEKNITHLTLIKKHYNNLNVEFKPVINNHTIGDLNALFEFINGTGWCKRNKIERILNNIVYFPQQLSPMILPNDIKNELISSLCKEYTNLKNILIESDFDEKQWKLFLKFTNLLDKFNGTDFFKTPTGVMFSKYIN